MLDSYSLLDALQGYLARRGLDPTSLNLEMALVVMVDWYRLVPQGALGGVAPPGRSDHLLFRYGAWSEGCATGFNVSILRRVRQANIGSGHTNWLAGLTLIFEPSAYRHLDVFSLLSSERDSLEAFLDAVENAPGYRACARVTPMTVAVENGALR